MGIDVGVGLSARFFGLTIGGIPIGIGGVISEVFRELTTWVAQGAGALIVGLGQTLDATTKPQLTGGFSLEFAVVVRIGAALAMPFLLLAIIQAIVHQDLGILLKAAFIRLPLAMILSGVAVEIVALALNATNGLSNDLLGVAGGSAQALFTNLATGIVQEVTTSVSLGGSAGVVLAAFAAGVAFFLWLELIVRSAAVVVATLFIPIALAGLVWSATAHWARRLGEVIAALVLSKLVVVGVLSLAALSVGSGTGISSVFEGIALLVLASLAPFSLLKLLPILEAGAISHLDGVAPRAARSGFTAGDATIGFAYERITSNRRDAQHSVIDEIGYFEGTQRSGADFGRLVDTVQADFIDPIETLPSSIAHARPADGDLPVVAHPPEATRHLKDPNVER
jgi:hypothetical protein